jgi:hypothetical protein
VAAERALVEKREEVNRWLRDQMGPFADCMFWFHPKRHPRFPKPFNLQIPTRKASRLTNYRWHDYGPFNPDRKTRNIEIDVAPTTLEFPPAWRGKGGYPLPPMPFPRRLPNQAFTLLPPLPRSIVIQKGLWRVPAPSYERILFDDPYRKEWAPWIVEDYRQRDDLPVRIREHDWMARWSWKLPRIDKRVPERILWREPAWFCGAITKHPAAYLTARPAHEVGFKLVRVGVCECTWRKYPVSTYVPQRRPRPPGRVGQSIADDDIWIVEAIEGRPWDDPQEPEPAWGDPGAEPELDVGLARDMGTRYAWQIPRDLPSSYTTDKMREMAWQEFAPRLTAPLKRGRPAASESRDGVLTDWFDHFDLWLAERRLRQQGLPRDERMARLASTHKISRAQAKRVHDAVRANLLAGVRLFNREMNRENTDSTD